MKQLHVTIIGAGVMGEAMARACLESRFVSKKTLTLIDVRTERLSDLKKQIGVQTTDTIHTIQSVIDILVIAVKPQDAVGVLQSIQPHLSKETLVVSIMAGIPIRALKKKLRHGSIVRAMPNTPAQIQQGMTVWFATHEVTTTQKKNVRRFLHTFGEEIEVQKEKLIDAATAISGSGPAYLFACAEYMLIAAKKIGFSPTHAQQLVQQTIFGAAKLLVQSGETPAMLRKRVTSKKGTTEAAFLVFDKKIPNGSIRRRSSQHTNVRGK